jgi:hypothetical protein
MVIYASMVNIPLEELKRVYTPLNTELTINEVQVLAQLVKIKTNKLWELIESKKISFQ